MLPNWIVTASIITLLVFQLIGTLLYPYTLVNSEKYPNYPTVTKFYFQILWLVLLVIVAGRLFKLF